MEDKSSGERKKLSLSLGGKLTLKKPISSSKLPSNVTTNARSGRSTVQVEVKRTKRPSTRLNINEKNIEINKRPKASGFRMIIDFSEPDKSMFIISTGQSGHFLSRNYDNLTNLWKQGDYIVISSNIPIILGGSKGKVVISPPLIK